MIPVERSQHPTRRYAGLMTGRNSLLPQFFHEVQNNTERTNRQDSLPTPDVSSSDSPFPQCWNADTREFPLLPAIEGEQGKRTRPDESTGTPAIWRSAWSGRGTLLRITNVISRSVPLPVP